MSQTESRLTGLPLVLATLAIVSSSFMNTLDTTIAIVALPTIAGNLAVTASQGSWVITLYGVCVAVVLPLSGWITRRFGEVHTFTFSVLLFTLASWLCGVSASFNQLLVFRAIQGIGGGLLLPLSQSLLLRIYPPEKHGLALALWAMATVTAPVLGPLLGGYITDTLGWPWIFYINIPIGALCVYLSWALLRPIESATERLPIDLGGLVLLVVGVVCLQLVLDRGHELDWLSATPIKIMSGISLLCFIFFLAWEQDELHPIVDLSLFGHRNFLIGTLSSAIFYMTFLVSAVIYPIWMQTSMGYTASWSGLISSPAGIAPLILMPLLGERIQHWDVRWTVTIGTALMIFAFYLHAQLSTDSPAWYLAMIRFVVGIGMPFAMMPLMLITLVGLPAEKMASATGIYNFVRMLAASLGTAVGVTIWDQRAIYHRSRLAEDISADSPQFQQAMDLLSAGLPDPQSALAALDVMVTTQARTLAMVDVFYLCAAGVVVVAVITWFLPARVTAGEVAD